MHYEIMGLITSTSYSLLILYPLMLAVKGILVKYGHHSIQIKNMSDNTVRSLAFIVFLLMILSAVLIGFNWYNWYGLLGPVQIILLFLFIPLYKKME